MADKSDLAAEIFRRAEAEVERAVGEFERGEDVHYPSFTYLDRITAEWEPGDDMPVLFPAERPVFGTLATGIVAEPPTGRTRYDTNAWLPRELVELDVPRLRAAARRAADKMIRIVTENRATDPDRILRGLYFAVWHSLRQEFSRQFSETARNSPVKLETFLSHAHLYPRLTGRTIGSDGAAKK